MRENRYIISFLLIIGTLTITQYPEVIARFNTPFTDPIISIDEDYFYIQDTLTYQIYIYSANDFRKINSFVKIGKGPKELTGGYIACITKDYIFIPQRGKVHYYSKTGILLREVEIPQMFSLQTYPIDNKIVGRYSPRETNYKERGRFENRLSVFTPGQGELKDIYTFATPTRSSRTSSNQKQIQIPPERDVSISSDGQNVVIGDRSKGMYFSILNQHGNIIREINIPYKRRSITEKDKVNVLKDSERRYGPLWTRIKNNYKIKFPKYFQPFASFKIDKGKIYVITDFIKDGKRECIVVDYNGEVLVKTFIQPVNSYTFNDVKMYYLIDNQETETWDLHVEEIE